MHQALSPSSALQPGDLPTLHFGEESRVWSLHKGLTEGQNFHRSSCFLPDLSTADFRADIGRRAGSQAAFSAIRLPRFEERQRGSVKHLAPTSSSVQSKLTQSGLLLLPRVPTRSEFHTVTAPGGPLTVSRQECFVCVCDRISGSHSVGLVGLDLTKTSSPPPPHHL